MPAVAAELWGTTVQHVLEQVRCGAIASRIEFGFAMVDIAPQSRAAEPPADRTPVIKPLTYVLAPQDDEEVQSFPGDWRERRMASSLLRRRPAA